MANHGAGETSSLDGRSNAARFYEQQLRAVIALFEDDNADEDAFKDDCIRLLADPQLPLPYRVPCGYMLAHASDKPDKEIRQALEIVGVIERMNEVHNRPPQAWLSNIKAELERILPGMQEIAAEIDRLSPDELEAYLAEQIEDDNLGTGHADDGEFQEVESLTSSKLPRN